ncbi:hypothetical protein [Kitasatospora sp. DSM 101779]|uniref:hypothetical protein n=1 Tax=Kitasatospora sp. DSM 101779 TaxID=2853165 RepID=UPI0021D955BB|nr:hypothetical protein [Kitasatospora sp. DSM 101779]MCU7826369.1 hypothetical protein [Kitasatospora sp. DSM 101779]
MRMGIEDVIALSGRGLGVTGRLAAGTAVGDRAWLSGPAGRLPVTVAGVERFRPCFAEDESRGETVALLLTGVAADEVHRGMLLCTDD